MLNIIEHNNEDISYFHMKIYKKGNYYKYFIQKVILTRDDTPVAKSEYARTTAAKDLENSTVGVPIRGGCGGFQLIPLI